MVEEQELRELIEHNRELFPELKGGLTMVDAELGVKVRDESGFQAALLKILQTPNIFTQLALIPQMLKECDMWRGIKKRRIEMLSRQIENYGKGDCCECRNAMFIRKKVEAEDQMIVRRMGLLAELFFKLRHDLLSSMLSMSRIFGRSFAEGEERTRAYSLRYDIRETVEAMVDFDRYFRECTHRISQRIGGKSPGTRKGRMSSCKCYTVSAPPGNVGRLGKFEN